MPEATEAPSVETRPLPPADPETDVYAVHGADPEVLAYAMAKYSRSSLTLRESLKEISASRAEQFLNTFYFQYGHRSIADLAHVAFAIERLSLLAAIELVDEQRWDGQERSTRYQNFKKSGWYTPQFRSQALRENYTLAVGALFGAYEELSGIALEEYKRRVPRPDEMAPDAYERTLKARAFDVARYLLPLSTNTSLGQIVNARTLETQVSRLLSSDTAEVRELGERLRRAATGAAWDVQGAAERELLATIQQSAPQIAEQAAKVLAREVHVAPTLVKYAVPNEYAQQSANELRAAAEELMQNETMAPSPVVDLLDNPPESELQIDLVTSLLYPHSHFSYRQIRDSVTGLSEGHRSELLQLGIRHRGRHDELMRAFSAAQGFRFDILMDIGGFRDMHRHRRCVQLRQEYTSAHGYEFPEMHEVPQVRIAYEAAMGRAFAATRELQAGGGNEWRYMLPLGTRCRSLFQMDFAEAVYISELRSAPQGHWSYRRVAFEMFAAIRTKHPELAQFIRVTDINDPVDPLKR